MPRDNLVESPFSFHFMGWTIEVYCNPDLQIEISPRSDFIQVRGGGGEINAAAIFLGCGLDTGLSQWSSLTGPVFVTGRRHSDGATLTNEVLWGCLNFLSDAMELYGDGGNPLSVFRRWGDKYKQRTWDPSGGDGGIAIYNTDARAARQNRMFQTVDHTSP